VGVPRAGDWTRRAFVLALNVEFTARRARRRYFFPVHAVREPPPLPDQPSADDMHRAVAGREGASGALVASASDNPHAASQADRSVRKIQNHLPERWRGSSPTSRVRRGEPAVGALRRSATG
jgi:hypothetical protein